MFSGTLTVGVRPTIVGSRNRKQTGFPPYGVVSHTRLMLLLFCSRARSESGKNVLFAHNIWLPPRFLALPGTDYDEASKTYEHTVLAAKFKGRGWSVSRGLASDMVPDPFLYQRICDAEHKTVFYQKNTCRNGSGSQVSSETSRHR